MLNPYIVYCRVSSPGSGGVGLRKADPTCATLQSSTCHSRESGNPGLRRGLGSGSGIDQGVERRGQDPIDVGVSWNHACAWIRMAEPE